MPSVFGLHCEQQLCVDDAAQYASALALRDQAMQQLQQHWHLTITPPTMIFCSTAQCQQLFGRTRAAAYTLGRFGIVVHPRGWKQHYIAHELIHHWQADVFGNLSPILGEPWVIEGMAYALSEDPRAVLAEPFQSYRQQFRDWHAAQHNRSLIDALATLL